MTMLACEGILDLLAVGGLIIAIIAVPTLLLIALVAMVER